MTAAGWLDQAAPGFFKMAGHKALHSFDWLLSRRVSSDRADSLNDRYGRKVCTVVYWLGSVVLGYVGTPG